MKGITGKSVLTLLLIIQSCHLCGAELGSKENPFEINSLEEFLAFRDTVNNGYYDACGALNCDIDLYSVCYETEDTIVHWKGIGDGLGIAYKGRFDGRGHCIRGMYARSDVECYKGIFATTDSACIMNLGAEDIYFRAGYYVGGIIAIANNTILTNCYTQGYLRGYFVSGIVGTSTNTTIKNCFSNCVVEGNYNGYISGYRTNTEIEHCFYNKNISGSKTSTDLSFGVSSESMQNGQLLNKLNEYVTQYQGDSLVYWHQDIHIDSFPTFTSTTEIRDIEATRVENYPNYIYNIQGINIFTNNPQNGNSTMGALRPGIYIYNRKKILIK